MNLVGNIIDNIKKVGEEEILKFLKKANVESRMLNQCVKKLLYDTELYESNENINIKNIVISIDFPENIFNIISEDKIDLIITHHPINKAHYHYPKIFEIYRDILNFCEDKSKLDNEVDSLVLVLENYAYSVNSYTYDFIWKNKGIHVICTHSIVDIMAINYLNEIVENMKYNRAIDIVKQLNLIPEIDEYRKDGLEIRALIDDFSCGKIFIDFLNGFVENVNLVQILKNSEFNTLMVMHISDEFLSECRKHKVNVINIPHIVADNIGINLLYKKINSKDFNIIPVNGVKIV